MRDDEEQLRHMERQHQRGELDADQIKRMERLRQIVASKHGEASQPKINTSSKEPIWVDKEHRFYDPKGPKPKGFNLYDKINTWMGNTPENLEFKRKKKEEYEKAYRHQVLKNQRVIAKRKAMKELESPHGSNWFGGFAKASVGEFKGMLEGARQFNEGSYSINRYDEPPRRSKRRGGGYRPRDLSDFIG